MFIARERELSYLNEFYKKNGVGITVIYGRRRIGKSAHSGVFRYGTCE